MLAYTIRFTIRFSIFGKVLVSAAINSAMLYSKFSTVSIAAARATRASDNCRINLLKSF